MTRKNTQVIKECISCNKNFKVQNYRKDTAKFCSKKCYGVDRSLNRNKKLLKIKKCKNCNKIIYDYKSNKRIFCSAKCRSTYFNKNNNKIGFKNNNKKWNNSKSIENQFKKGDIPWWIKKNMVNPSTLSKIKIKKSNSMKGILSKENNPNWKGGISKERDLLASMKEYKEWRLDILERDNYVCQICNKRGGKLNVHHIIPYYKNKKYCIDIKNGITLCQKCHNTLNGKEIEKAIDYGWLKLNDVPKYMDKPKLIDGNIFCNDLGVLKFCNDFNFEKWGIKRMYCTQNFNLHSKRAFHGHLLENKIIWVINGTFKIICCKIKKNINNIVEIKTKKPYEFILSSKKPQMLIIPKGYANGFKALEENSIIQFFSTSTIDESKNDDYRFDWKKAGEEIWKTKNR